MTIRIETTDLMSILQAAKELGKPRATIYRWAEKRKIITIQLGGILFVPRSEIERLNKERNSQATESGPVA